MRAKLADVARVAGVSLTTASFAMRESSRVSAATRAKIRRVAKELGYTPDPTAQTLASGALRKDVFHGTIGVLLHPDERERVARRVQKTFFDVLPESAASLGYALDVFELPLTKRAASALGRTLMSRGIRGLLVQTDNLVLPDVGFPWEKFAAIHFGCNSGDYRFHRINTHSFNDAYNAVLRCHERGYRRFGLAIDTKSFPDWLGGFEAAVYRLGVAAEACVCDSNEWDEALFLTWFDRVRPEVVVANHGSKPLDTLAKRGLHAPQDFGLFALDLNDVRPEISGWNQMRARAYQLAIESLHGLLRRNELGMPPAATLIDVAGHWNEGGTLRPPSGNA